MAKPLTSLQIAKIHVLARSGLTQEEIAYRLKIGKTTVATYYRDVVPSTQGPWRKYQTSQEELQRLKDLGKKKI